jgi:hypothetical protein
VALLEKRRYLNNRSGDFPQVILIVPSHVPNSTQLRIFQKEIKSRADTYIRRKRLISKSDYNLKSGCT